VSTVQSIWAMAPFPLLLALLFLFVKRRRSTRDYAETRIVKARLPAWVKLVELGALVIFLPASVMICLALWNALLVSVWHSAPVMGVGEIYGAIGVFLIAVPPAFLCVNLMSFLVPPLRRANFAAFATGPVSFASANSGLLKAWGVSLPVGLGLLALSVLQPWGA